RARLGENGDPHPVWDEVLLDQFADEVVIRLRGGGEADLDLVEAQLDEQLEQAALAPAVHRIHKRLVAVAQIGGAPDGSLVDHHIRPRPVGQWDDFIWTVFPEWHRHGGAPLRTHFSRRSRAENGYVAAAL